MQQTYNCSQTLTTVCTQSTSQIKMLQASSHTKSCIKDEALEDLPHEGGGSNHMYPSV